MLNDGYLPKGMVEKEFRWEYVNYALYHHLKKLNTEKRLHERIKHLLRLQESQIMAFQQMSATRANLLRNHPNYFEPPHHIPDLLAELTRRENELLKEYQSYPMLISNQSHESQYLRNLISTKRKQINQLLELQQYFEYEVESNQRQEYFLTEGYELEKVVGDLTFPTVMTFDGNGNMYLAEAGYAYGADPGEGRILKIDAQGNKEEIVRGLSVPVTGITWFEDSLYIAEGGFEKSSPEGCGTITKLTANGEKQVIVSGLKTCGDHFTGDIKVGPDKRLYFTVGTATNSAVVGTDNQSWLKRNRQFHDTPARDYVVYGKNFITKNPLSSQGDIAETGAFKPFGVPNEDGEVIKGSLYANGVIYCCDLDGSNLHVYADGFRNPFGLTFSPFNGKLYVTDNGADDRGSRPIKGDWDNFWEVKQNGWYGWPDFFSGLPANRPHFHVEGKPKPTFLIKNHPKLAGQPVVRFEPHSSSNKFSFSTNQNFGFVGEAFVGQLGGMDGKKGLKVVRVNMETGQIRDFYRNEKGLDLQTGPKRPVAALFHPNGEELFVVDFGLMGPREKSAGTGSIWRINRK
ncbi:Glucose/arabinose dehydrogenase, beta-propeller fold [Mesobacillus persicus]|uniref:Glucose/arabinose dehydrogenase, beta-propeller fold n=1 Tax=Mesobacillus persicus TaxID=930146 RepID=A0A1H7YY03_9BACI|nr:PQQ-dependent sugar dehydrogenase [Mesobacillus persicus]SEM50845.1 Glucose/arabinose dehydrogenase, beta-propeller fold [Mesobacillus persicus]